MTSEFDVFGLKHLEEVLVPDNSLC